MAVTSRASVLYGARDLRVDERPLPPPEPHELQVAIQATTLCGSDLHYYKHFRNGDIQIQEPLTLGHESAGIVIVVGSSVNDFIIGDRVALEVGVPCGQCPRCEEGRYNICSELKFRGSAKSFPHYQGTLQEKINHPAKWCHKLPDSIPFAGGALVEPISVAMHAVDRGQLPQNTPQSTKERPSVLVIGAGVIGALCAGMHNARGAKIVKIMDTQKDRTTLAVECGFADQAVVIAPTKASAISEILEISKLNAKEACSGLDSLGFDVVMECTGAEVSTQTAIYSTRPGGRVVIVGMGTPVQTLPISAAALREIDIVGTFRYAHNYPAAIAWLKTSGLGFLDKMGLFITHRYRALENVKQAFETGCKSYDDEGKPVLKVLIHMEPAHIPRHANAGLTRV